MSPLSQLRAHAVTHSLFPATSLKTAFDRLGFVQADPIRSPARAQDLILRHRVKDYRAGHLEKRYASLGLEEDYLYAYGFMHRRVWEVLHPRHSSRLSTLEKRVFDAVRLAGQAHPAELEAEFGRSRVINAWGGYSKATTQALDQLQYRGLLRVARRDNGIRVYEPAAPCHPTSPDERLRTLILTIAGILAPIPMKTLRSNISRYRLVGNPMAMMDRMRRSGELESATAEGLEYVWPATRPEREPHEEVRILAPFDPIVWDRLRFEHIWGWPYRFEAYTPPAKRVRGYYAMPLLWRDQVIGWTNASTMDGKVNLEFGFVGKRPRDREFRRELEAETERFMAFLQ